MNITDYQAQYFAHELTRRHASDDLNKLTASLQDAIVDLNPHQIEAALFAFQSPLSKGAILADEVGLGKTIEAGILLSQFWATGKRRLLVIGPSSLRKQWSQELSDKFHLESRILESKFFNDLFAAGKKNPFEQDAVVICSFHFARNKEAFLRLIDWDLVVIDEAHRLRNCYKPNNKIGKAIKEAIYPSKKVLLTATPLQNSLMELYGLISIIDETVFGSVETFRSQFTRLDDSFEPSELKDRIEPVVQRTLRRQVKEYIRYTQRIPITISYVPSQQEQDLYDAVSNYLSGDFLYALPSSQRHLLTLIIRKLLASSTYAITGTLDSLIRRLEKLLDDKAPTYDLESDLWNDMEHLDELIDEWDSEIEENQDKLSIEEVDRIKSELDELRRFREMAIAIEHDAKGQNLFMALEQGFLKLSELGAQKKAIIFTESRRTQEYLFQLLQGTEHKGKVLLFNGTNNDDFSKKIYKSWFDKYLGTDRVTGSKTADKRQALVDYFKNEANIMIATEAAAEGINLQFCSMLINYDLPWNPQRIEQRIGRCHRYGQKHDVVVVNFLNTSNAADVRVHELLDQKLNLFSGVFGASDEVLGALESGVDFEKVIAAIYQSCRTTEEINEAFDKLQKQMEDLIQNKMRSAQEKLMEHFDAEVIDKLKTRLHESQVLLTRFEKWLWLITQKYLANHATFTAERTEFKLHKNPFDFKIATGTYTLDKKNTDSRLYRINHPLAKGILNHYKSLSLQVAEIEFDLSGYDRSASILNPIAEKGGWLQLSLAELDSFENTDYLVFTAVSDDGYTLSQEQAQRLFELPAQVTSILKEGDQKEFLNSHERSMMNGLQEELKSRDAAYLNREVQKLNQWAEDRVYLLEKEMRDTKQRIKEFNRQAGSTNDPAELLTIQKKVRDLESKQRKQRQEIFYAEDQIKEQRDQMIDQIEARMDRKFDYKPIFTIKWHIK